MAVSLVQQQQATIGAGAAASVAFTLGATPTQGNMLVCAWEHNDNGTPVMSGTGVTWTRHTLFVGDASHDNTSVFTGVVNAGASTTQTFTLGVSSANAAGILLEFSGVQQAVDGTPPTPTNLSSATPSITSNTPTVGGDLAVAFMGQVTAIAPTATPAGWSAVTGATNTRRIDGAWNINAGISTISAQWTYATSKFALAEIVLIKALPTSGAPQWVMSNNRTGPQALRNNFKSQIQIPYVPPPAAPSSPAGPGGNLPTLGVG